MLSNMLNGWLQLVIVETIYFANNLITRNIQNNLVPHTKEICKHLNYLASKCSYSIATHYWARKETSPYIMHTSLEACRYIAMHHRFSIIHKYVDNLHYTHVLSLIYILLFYYCSYTGKFWWEKIGEFGKS